jgi:purine-cytosine permease-like protein
VVGIIIVGIGSLIPCFIGYHMVHHYERFAWIIITIVMLFLWGLGAKAGYDINAQKSLEDTGKALKSDILSFGGIVFGSFTGVSFWLLCSVMRLMPVSSGHLSQLTTIVDFP